MLAGLGLLAVSAVILIAGAELFTENAAAAARRLQITARMRMTPVNLPRSSG